MQAHTAHHARGCSRQPSRSCLKGARGTAACSETWSVALTGLEWPVNHTSRVEGSGVCPDRKLLNRVTAHPTKHPALDEAERGGVEGWRGDRGKPNT